MDPRSPVSLPALSKSPTSLLLLLRVGEGLWGLLEEEVITLPQDPPPAPSLLSTDS